MKNRRVRRVEAFAELFEEHAGGVFETAWLIVRDREVAADITEQTFAEGWAQFHRTPHEMFEMWLLARSRDRAFNWLYVHHPDGLDPDQLGPPDDAVLGRLLQARVARNLLDGQVPIRAEVDPEPAPPPPPAVVPPPPEEPVAVPVWPVGWKETAPPDPPPPPLPPPPEEPPAAPAPVPGWMHDRPVRSRRRGEDRTEIRRQRLAGVAVGAAVGLALIVALRVDEAPKERAASRTSATEDPPEEQPHQHPTTTTPAPPSTQLVAATQTTAPPTPTSRRPTTTTTAPPPTSPPTTKPPAPVISAFQGQLVDNMSCGYDPNTLFNRRMLMTWTAAGGTSGRIRPEGGPWVPVNGSSGSYEVCGPTGVRWYLEIANPGGTAKSSTVPGMFPGAPPPFTVPQG